MKMNKRIVYGGLFNDVVFTGALNESHIVQTQFGWHLIDILERTE